MSTPPGTMNAAPDDGITSCVACRSRISASGSYAGYLINAVGMAMFRLCPPCRDAADDQMLDRIREQAEQRLLLTGPARGRA